MKAAMDFINMEEFNHQRRMNGVDIAIRSVLDDILDYAKEYGCLDDLEHEIHDAKGRIQKANSNSKRLV